MALPWATTHHHQTRCFAHMVLDTLLRHFPPSMPMWNGRAAFLEPLQRFTADNVAARRLVSACGLVLQPDAANLADVRAMLSGAVALAGASGLGEALEAAPVPLMDRILACLQHERQQLRAGGTEHGALAPSSAFWLLFCVLWLDSNML